LDGPFAIHNSSLLITNCTMANNGLGPQAIYNSWTRVKDSTVDNCQFDIAWDNSVLEYHDTTITGMYETYADNGSYLQYIRSSVQAQFLGITRSSSLQLTGTSLSGWCPPGCLPGDELVWVSVASHSSAHAVPAFGGTESNIGGIVHLHRFSDGSFETGDPITGRVVCTLRSRVLTNHPPVGGTSELCE
jgi:hypothetical protein